MRKVVFRIQRPGKVHQPLSDVIGHLLSLCQCHIGTVQVSGLHARYCQRFWGKMPQLRQHLEIQIRSEHPGTSNEIRVSEPFITSDVNVHHLRSRELDEDRLFEHAVPPISPRVEFPVIVHVEISANFSSHAAALHSGIS